MRGYKNKAVKETINQFPFSKREESLKRKKRKTENPPLVLPLKYSDACTKVKATVHKHWNKVEKDGKLNIFPQKNNFSRTNL